MTLLPRQRRLWCRSLCFFVFLYRRVALCAALSSSSSSSQRKSPALWRLLEYHDQENVERNHKSHNHIRRPPEVMAPAGGFPQLHAAVANGADAVYVGLAAFSARARAANFDAEQLIEAVRYCHAHNVHLYVAMNTLIFDHEWHDVAYWIRTCQRAGVDALIVQDVGLCRILQKMAPDLVIHASTQQSITDAHGVQFAATQGAATRVVLGRELSVAEIAHVYQQTVAHDRSNTGTVPELEVFCHGALCVSYSGQCFSSEAWGGRSANRGQCAQACRLPYGLVVNGKLRDDRQQDMAYLLSPQDLMGLEYVPQLIQSGVACLKIEGRLKDATYVAATTRAYRQAVDDAWQRLFPHDSQPQSRSPPAALAAATTTTAAAAAATAQRPGHVPIERSELVQLFARGQDEKHDGLTPGFLAGTRHQVVVRGRSPRHRGVHVGHVVAAPSRSVPVSTMPHGGLWVHVDEGIQLKLGDGLVVDRGRPQEDELGGTIYEIQQGFGEHRRTVLIDLGRDVQRKWRRHEQQGDVLAPIGAHVWRTHDAIVAQKFRKLATAKPTPVQSGVQVQVTGQQGEPLQIILSSSSTDGANRQVVVATDEPLQAAKTKGLSNDQIRKAIGTLGNTNITINGDVQVTGMEGLWCPVSQIKKARRRAVDQWEALLSNEPSHDTDTDGMDSTGDAASAGSGNTATSVAVTTSRSDHAISMDSVLHELLSSNDQGKDRDQHNPPPPPLPPRISVLCRTYAQVNAVCQAIESDENTVVSEIMVDFLELDGMKEAMDRIRQTPSVRAVVASPRILKPEEGGIWKSLLALRPDALLVRSTGLLYRMQSLGGEGARVDVGTVQGEEEWVTVPQLLGDFSLNVANAITATELLQAGLSRVTASYDINARSIRHMATLLQDSAPKLEVVVHCHMPIFHTEHCVFARFLSQGNSYLDCGHVCTHNNVHLRDEMTGLDNLVLADMGCRNTVFSAQAQTGLHSLTEWNRAGIQHFRIELVDEDEANARGVLQTYTEVLQGRLKPSQAWETLEYIRDSNGRAAGVSLGSFRNTKERQAGVVLGSPP